MSQTNNKTENCLTCKNSLECANRVIKNDDTSRCFEHGHHGYKYEYDQKKDEINFNYKAKNRRERIHFCQLAGEIINWKF